MRELLMDSWRYAVPAVAIFLLLILRDVFISFLSRQLERVNLERLFPLGKYANSLRERLAEMPFLFRDMELSATEDFVETVVATADTKAESLGSYADYRTPTQRFKEARRAILFGNGGYGKTTLFRHLALRILDGRARANGFEKNLVPIFVSLKTVSLSAEFPILEALQATDPVFSGDSGYKRLKRLAKKSRLAIFLDGYDEVPYAGGVDHLIKELETFFGSYDKRRPNFFEQHKDFYIFVKECRVYLSSRREFFFHYPVRSSMGTPHLLVKGLGDRRAELLEKVFSRYAASSQYLASRLSHELFLQQLAVTCDENLQELSYSPLFLTVMAYVYVEAVKSPDCDGKVVFSGGAPELIKQCINLLLTDVDQHKARGLSEVQRQALINRRAAYPIEKYEFLKFFAAQLYETNTSIFNRDTLIELALQYFSSESEVGSKTIIRGLGTDDPTINIVDQLIFSGLFVVVDARGKENRMYDFPHRRFRETLAVAFYDNPEGAERIVKRFDAAAYGELALVFVEQSDHAARVLEGVLERFGEPAGYKPKHGEFLADAFRRASAKPDDSVTRRFFELLAATPGAKAPRELVKHLPRTNFYKTYLIEKIDVSVVQESSELTLRFTCLSELFPDDIEVVLGRAVDSCGHKSLRGLLFAPIEMPVFLRKRIMERTISEVSDSRQLVLALFDIYRSSFSGKSAAQKAVVHEVIREHMHVIAKLLFRKFYAEDLAFAALDYAFGGARAHVDGMPVLDLKESPVPAPFQQLY